MYSIGRVCPRENMRAMPLRGSKADFRFCLNPQVERLIRTSLSGASKLDVFSGREILVSVGSNRPNVLFCSFLPLGGVTAQLRQASRFRYDKGTRVIGLASSRESHVAQTTTAIISFAHNSKGMNPHRMLWDYHDDVSASRRDWVFEPLHHICSVPLQQM
jgi:hypothetical protein